MAKVKKIILDTAEFHPLHKAWLNLAKRLAEEFGAELEVKKEDYLFAIDHGQTDDLGMASLPQLFVELDDGRIVLVLAEYPFDPKTTKPDKDMAYEQAKKKILEIIGQ
ncbi:MAG: hypothetical protein F7C34_00635 [Desulfurococcales archaeon]|nr:hypothetical protein [Desulfurococcales archaeon]